MYGFIIMWFTKGTTASQHIAITCNLFIQSWTLFGIISPWMNFPCSRKTFWKKNIITHVFSEGSPICSRNSSVQFSHFKMFVSPWLSSLCSLTHIVLFSRESELSRVLRRWHEPYKQVKRILDSVGSRLHERSPNFKSTRNSRREDRGRTETEPNDQAALKGHSHLVHMRITFHSIANLHIPETR